jgi:CRISPR-associated endonuclease/helicase Cas3
VTKELLASYTAEGPHTLQGYLNSFWWMTALPQKFNRFRKSEHSTKLFLCYEDEELRFIEKDKQGNLINKEKTLNICQEQLSARLTEKLWLIRDYYQSITKEAKEKKVSKHAISLRFGEINFVKRKDDSEYEYNDQFGLFRI